MSAELDNPLRERQALYALVETDGWKLVCAKYDALFAQLTVDALDPKTDRDTAEHLRQVRPRIADEFAPRRIVENRLAVIESQIKKLVPPKEQPPVP